MSFIVEQDDIDKHREPLTVTLSSAEQSALLYALDIVLVEFGHEVHEPHLTSLVKRIKREVE